MPKADATWLVGDMDHSRGDLPPAPRIRASIAEEIVLTTTYQTVPFALGGQFDINSFPLVDDEQKVELDNGVFTFRNPTTQNFVFRFRPVILADEASSILVGLAKVLGASGSHRCRIYLRFLSVSSGTQLAEREITTLESTDTWRPISFADDIYFSANGPSLAVQVKTDNASRNPKISSFDLFFRVA